MRILIEVIANFINILGTVLFFAIFIRALMSWFMPQDSTGISRVLADITEPILQPIRRVLPSIGGLDFSPWVAMILIQLVSRFLISLLVSGSA